MSRISRNISIILKAERLIAQRQVAVAAKRTGIYAAAGFAVGLAVIMLNIAGFFWLSSVISKPFAALILAGANILLAIILAQYAKSMTAQDDTTAAVELRDMAMLDIESEIKEGLSEARNTVSGIRRDPIGTLTPEIVSSLVGMAIKYGRSRKKTQDD